MNRTNDYRVGDYYVKLLLTIENLKENPRISTGRTQEILEQARKFIEEKVDIEERFYQMREHYG